MNTPTPPRHHLGRSVPPLLAFIAVAFAAINLRPGISSLGPVLTEVQDAFGQGGSFGGILTAIPGFAFGLFGVTSVAIARKLGLSGALLVGAGFTLAGLALRPWVTSVWLFVLLTIFVAAGIAVGNVLLPAWIKRHGADRSVRLMTVYTSILGGGGAIGPVTALVFLDGAGKPNWQPVLFAWAIVAILPLVAWVFTLRKTGYDFPPDPPMEQASTVPVWRSSTAVFMMLMFGLQAMQAYVQFGWLPAMLTGAGLSAGVGVAAVMVTHGLGIVAGLVMPTVVARSRHLPVIVTSFGLFAAAGYALIILIHLGAVGSFAAPVALAASGFLGIGGWCFATAIAMIPARTRSPLITAKLSGFVQPVGYILAGLGPLLVGAGFERAGSWVPVLTALIISCLIMSAIGYRSATGAMVDDQLAVRR